MDTPQSAQIEWSLLPEHAPLPGITGRVRQGDELSAALFHLESGAIVPRHTHANEEFGQVLEGSLRLEAGGEQRDLVEGDSFLIPGDVPHSAVAGPAGCVLLECYAPPRNPFVPTQQGVVS